jgi:hypothetical protein
MEPIATARDRIAKEGAMFPDWYGQQSCIESQCNALRCD